MNDQTDSQLLRAYAEHRSEPAFAELVRRHVDFVYSAALRMVCDSHLAQDVTQGVFVALAKSATQLVDRPVLSGWLHRTAQNIAAQTVRTDVRRRAREQEAAAMNELLAVEADADWEHIAPHLDTALGELSEPDRDAVLLRYFEKKSAQEMAEHLGISDDAAQKRVSRAVERLREFFAKRGVNVGTSGLTVVISANAVQAAPVGLALTISTAAVLT
ncbi:MAG: sigma-70 family RNA polymerase sigma factor, partial [Akkermansiaceae bacterium]|nr:sigma-70 family RNA polymerase sigma factor [Verrucomicrobiales bacterium]